MCLDPTWYCTRVTSTTNTQHFALWKIFWFLNINLYLGHISWCLLDPYGYITCIILPLIIKSNSFQLFHHNGIFWFFFQCINDSIRWNTYLRNHLNTICALSDSFWIITMYSGWYNRWTIISEWNIWDLWERNRLQRINCWWQVVDINRLTEMCCILKCKTKKSSNQVEEHVCREEIIFDFLE